MKAFTCNWEDQRAKTLDISRQRRGLQSAAKASSSGSRLTLFLFFMR
jgi:hypothetical protein